VGVAGNFADGGAGNFTKLQISFYTARFACGGDANFPVFRSFDIRCKTRSLFQIINTGPFCSPVTPQVSR